MTKKEIKQPQFKIIEDSKDEPNLKEAQKFVGGYVEGITFAIKLVCMILFIHTQRNLCDYTQDQTHLKHQFKTL